MGGLPFCSGCGLPGAHLGHQPVASLPGRLGVGWGVGAPDEGVPHCRLDDGHAGVPVDSGRGPALPREGLRLAGELLQGVRAQLIDNTTIYVHI